jgi:hypothetical protein
MDFTFGMKGLTTEKELAAAGEQKKGKLSGFI